MDNFKIITQASPWFIVLCLVAGALYAFALYQKNAPWNTSTNRLLAGLRFLLVSLLCFLLLGPFVRQIQNIFEKPTIVFAIDNSESVAMTTDSTKLIQVLQQLSTAKQALEEEGLQVEVQTLSNQQSLNDIQFANASTDLNGLLGTIQTNYENRNLGAVILISDGIYNQGVSPTYRPFAYPVSTVALGDTTPRQDINLRTIYYNKVAYLGNKFPLVAEVQNTGFKGRAINLVLKQNGKVLEKKTLNLRSEEDMQQATFLITAQAKGMQHFIIEAEALEEEFTLRNNLRHAYVEIIDSKEKILLVAQTPHPDIKAIKSALDKQDNYELTVHIPGISPLKEDQYDLVILHQVPDLHHTTNAVLEKYLNSKTALWYIVGSQTDLNRLNSLNNALKITARGAQKDEVTPAFNGNFARFKFQPEHQSLLTRLSPMTVPFGDYALGSGAEAVLFHRVGSLITEKPLLALQANGDRKTAVLAGEGLWLWRLREFELTEKHEVVDELITKMVQLLSAKEDKRKFRFYPVATEINESERVIFEAEVYNDIFEKIYNQKIDISLTNENGEVKNYSFVNTEANSRFELAGLPQGVYRYAATTALQGGTEKSTGEFTVRKIELEALHTTADHQLLRQVAMQSGGKFFQEAELGTMAEWLKENKGKDIIRSNEEMLEIIHLKWVFFLLLGLISIEWFLRKYKGAY